MPKVHIKPILVSEAEIDVHRHVNNQEYLRWMQEVAIEHSALQGWPMARYLESGASWYVKSHFIDYLRPAVLGDTLLACTWVATMGETSSARHTLFLRERNAEALARAETQWIFVNLKTGRPLPIPPEVARAFVIEPSEAAVLEEVEQFRREAR